MGGWYQIIQGMGNGTIQVYKPISCLKQSSDHGILKHKHTIQCKWEMRDITNVTHDNWCTLELSLKSHDQNEHTRKMDLKWIKGNRIMHPMTLFNQKEINSKWTINGD